MNLDNILDLPWGSPFSPKYLSQQLDLYREISGRAFDQAANEMTDFDIEGHIAAPNPYNNYSPSRFVLHYLRLGHALKEANLPDAPRVLDMGAGWGLSSEFFAQMGAKVTAVDINPKFVELINARAKRSQFAIVAHTSSFENFRSTSKFDAIFFYECLHHAAEPWTLLANLRELLVDGGSLMFAGEPVNHLWWPNWGLRLDPLSIYCIRKWGWFESGWSRNFVHQMFDRAGYVVALTEERDREIGFTAMARKKCEAALAEHYDASQLSKYISFSGWDLEDDWIVNLGSGRMYFSVPTGAKAIELEVCNFRARAIEIIVTGSSPETIKITLPVGETKMALDLGAGFVAITFSGEDWVPAREIGNEDERRLLFHLRCARFI